MPELHEPEDLRQRQLQVLTDCDLLEGGGDAELAAAARVAAAVTGYQLAVVNVLLPDQQCSLALVGGALPPVSREDSLCHRATLVGGPVVSGDCATDPRFADLPWVDGRLGRVRRYAMAPLQVDGITVGTLCALDEQAGPALEGDPLERLVDLADMTSSLLERRRQGRLAHEAAEELARARAFDRALLEALPLGVVAADADRRVTVFNTTSRRWHGLDADAAVEPEQLSQAYSLFELDGTTPLAPHRVPLLRAFTEDEVVGAEFVIRPAGALPRTISASARQVRDAGGRLLGAVAAMADVTAQRALEAQLRTAATHDVLTGLPNRALLVEHLTVALSEAHDDAGHVPWRVAVLYCDLDGFKAVNDLHGHAAGDAVLLEVARRLSAAVRPQDVVARLGGDEFVLVCPGVADAAQAEALARRIAAVVAEPVVVDGVEHRVGVSVGTELSRPGEGSEGAERLLSAADAAMFARKRARRDRRAAGLPDPAPVPSAVAVPAPR
ncbi:diguanylate cyclase domain-containing protein [Quadrisphaera sp. KR29]|uniref:diguanylate cyclase domain-containing protein n=1 Tax=Quadrisphaera sp. KR29 TaxID=3461391 RepID=UPI004043F44A